MPTSARMPRRSRQIACWSVASLRNRLVDEDELLGGGQAVGAALGDALAHLGLDAGDADHEELIKVIGGNRQKSHPFQRGMAGIDQFLQHPAIEMQPGKLAIDEAFGAARPSPEPASTSGFFFFNYNGLRGFHEVSIHLKAGRSAIPASAAQTMCYRDDVSMTLMFPPPRAVKMRSQPADQALRSNSAASARVTGRPSRSASVSSSSTACRAAA